MRIKFGLIGSLLIMNTLVLLSQPPCGVATDEPPGCIICGLIYSGNTFGFTPELLVKNFCGNVENSQWISFQARSTYASARITTNNCQNDNGIEAVMTNKYFYPISNCFSSTGSVFDGTLQSSKLTPGELYYIIVDGFEGDICDFELVLEGAITSDAVGEIDTLYTYGAVDLFCPDQYNIVHINSAENAASYKWEIIQNGEIISSYQSLSKSLGFPKKIEAGPFEICVTPFNNCVIGSTYCKTYQMELAGSCQCPQKICADIDELIFEAADLDNDILLVGDPQIDYGCFSNVSNPRWIYFEAKKSGSLSLKIVADGHSQVNSAIWGPFEHRQRLRADCSLNESPIFCSTSDSLVINGLVAGHFYKMIVDFGAVQPFPMFKMELLSGNDIIRICSADPCGVAADDPPGCRLCGPVYSGNTEGFTPSLIPEDFCGTVENNQWITFMAQAASTSLSITTFNCLNEKGVEFVVTDRDLNIVSNCFSSEGTKTFGNITATGLTPGEDYYIMIDGYEGDTCDLVLNLVGAIHVGPPDPPIFNIEPDLDFYCLGDIVCYSFQNYYHYYAPDYEWVFPSNVKFLSYEQNRKKVYVEYIEEGISNMGLRMLNSCLSEYVIFAGDKEVINSYDLEMNVKYEGSSAVIYWTHVSDSNRYEVFVNGQSQGVQEEHFFVLTDVQTDDIITCEVVYSSVQNNCFFGNEIKTFTVPDCPNVVLKFEPIPDICLGDGKVYNLNDFLKITGSLDSLVAEATWTDGNNANNYVSRDGVFYPDLANKEFGDGPVSLRVSWKEKNNCVFRTIGQVRTFSKPRISETIYPPIWWFENEGSIELFSQNGQSNNSYNWSNGSNEKDLFNVEKGTYCVTVTDDYNCQNMDCFLIGNGTYRISPLKVICRGESTTLTIRPDRGADFNWSPSTALSCTNCPNPIASPNETTKYTIEATLANGKIGTTDIWVIVLPRILCANQPRLAEKIIYNEMSFEQVEKLVLNQFISYPNPVKDELSIYSLSPIQDITLFDLTGKRLEVETDILLNEAIVDLDQVSSGTIFIKVKTANGVRVERIVKQ